MQHYRREIRADQNKKARSSQRRDSTLHKLTSCSLLKTPPSHNVVTSTTTLLVGTTSYGRNHRSHQQTEEPSNKKPLNPTWATSTLIAHPSTRKLEPPLAIFSPTTSPHYRRSKDDHTTDQISRPQACICKNSITAQWPSNSLHDRSLGAKLPPTPNPTTKPPWSRPLFGWFINDLHSDQLRPANTCHHDRASRHENQ